MRIFHGAHFALATYLSSLSSSSHLAAIVTLRKYVNDNPTLALLHIGLISAFALGLPISTTLKETFRVFFDVFWIDGVPLGDLGYLLVIWPIPWAFWRGIWQIIPKTRGRFTA